MKDKISTAQLSKLLDCTTMTLHNYKKAGIIKSPKGAYSLADITAVVKHLREQASGRNMDESEREIKIRREKIRCEREERKNAVEAGKLIDKDEEYKKDFNESRIVRDNVLNVCERMRPHVNHEQYVKLKKEITDSLAELAGVQN